MNPLTSNFLQKPVDSYMILFKNKQQQQMCRQTQYYLMDYNFELAVMLFLLQRHLSPHYPVPHSQRIAPLSCLLASIQNSEC